MSKKTIISDILALLGYSLVFLILTYPLILNFSSGIIGNYNSDGPIFLWNAWHFPQHPFSLQTTDILYPNISPLGLHTYTQFQSLVVLLLSLLFKNLILSFNLSFLLFSILGGYFSYKFFYLLSKEKLASFLGGQFFVFQSIWSIYALFGTQNFLALWFIPATLYFYELFRKKNKLKYSLSAGLVISLAFINGFYPFIFSLGGLIIYSLLINFAKYKKVINLHWRFTWSAILSFTIIAGWKIILLWQQKEFIESTPTTLLSNIDRIYHADPMNLIRPVQFHSLWGHWHTWFREMSIENGNAFVGFTFAIILLLFIIVKLVTQAKFKYKKIFFILLTAYLLTLSLSFGPYLHLFGYETGLPMPHYFIQLILPSYNNLRFPARWLLLAQIFLSGLTVFLLKYIFQNISKKTKIILFIIISIGLTLDVSFLPRTITTLNSQNTKAWQIINQQPDNKTVMHIPLAISSGYFDFSETTKRSMAYQTIHNKPIIGGHLSRLPDSYRNYNQEPILKYILDYKNNPPNEEDLSSANIELFFAKYNLGYVVIDKQRENLESTEAIKLLAYLKGELGLERLYEDEWFIVFKK